MNAIPSVGGLEKNYIWIYELDIVGVYSGSILHWAHWARAQDPAVEWGPLVPILSNDNRCLLYSRLRIRGTKRSIFNNLHL